MAFPPQVAHTGRRISPDEALAKVTDYLEKTNEAAYLHPTAILTEGGPTTSTGSANIGLILHNLQRIQAGLAGKTLAPELALEDDETISIVDPTAGNAATSATAKTLDGIQHDHPTTTGMRADVARTITGAEEAEMDWQSSGEFAREQEELQGEIGPRDNAIANPPTSSVPASSKDDALKAPVDKDARRRAKKERRSTAKKEAEKKRQRPTEA